MSWLIRRLGLLGVSRKDKHRNADIRNRLGQKETVLEKIQRSKLRLFGHVERMHNDQLPFLALHTLLPGRRSRERPRKRWTEDIKEDRERRGFSM